MSASLSPERLGSIRRLASLQDMGFHWHVLTDALGDLLAELDRTTADLAVAIEVARERADEIDRLRAPAHLASIALRIAQTTGMTLAEATDAVTQVAGMQSDVERLRTVAAGKAES